MLTSITPLGERGKGNRWGVTTTAYVVGSAVGGAALGVLGGAVGMLLRPVLSDASALMVLGAVCLLAALVDLSGRRIPSWRRQVDEQWLQAFRGWVYGGGFGLQLGFGVVTIITSASTYVVVAAAVLSGSAWGGMLIGVTFGLVRGAVLLSARSVQEPEDLARFHQRLDGSGRLAARITIGALVIAAAAAAVPFLPLGASA